MLPETISRVREHTAEKVNKRISRQIECNIAYFGSAGPEAIDERLKELDREWDIERTLQTNASTLALLGLTLGATISRKWFILPGVVLSFLLQHSLQGWCPPVPLFRRMGFRTPTEIDYERYALKTLRGDFENLPAGEEKSRKAGEVFEAVRK
jgi:hypothetical protein